jgi:hypothetical protein
VHAEFRRKHGDPFGSDGKLGTQVSVAGFDTHYRPNEEIAMLSKFAIAALAAASLLATTALVSAQTDYAKPSVSGSAETGVGTGSHVKHHKMRSSHVRTGTTTGMSHRSSTAKSKPGGEPTSNKPAAQ